MAEQSNFARIVVVTDRVWRAEQLAQFLLAMDGVCSRLAWAASLADMLKHSDWVLTNCRMYGLVDQGPPKAWPPTDPNSADGLSRSDYLKWTLMLRSYGIRVQEEQLSWSLAFDVEDLLDTIPTINRCEVESLQMSSPGWLTFLMAGTQAKPAFIALVQHFFDSIAWRRETRLVMGAAAQVAQAEAVEAMAKALQSLRTALEDDVSPKTPEVGTSSSSDKCTTHGGSLQVSFEKQQDQLSLDLRDAGFPLAELQRVLLKPLEDDMNRIYQAVSQGLVQFATVAANAGDEANDTR